MKRIIARLILITDTNPNFWDKTKYSFSVFLQFAPVVFILDLIDWWFTENKQFGTFMCIALVFNLIVGAWAHLRSKTFCFKRLILRNLELCAIVIAGYTMLEMLRYTAGNNIAGDLFRISIQIMTLMYPGSKIFKNIFIISNGRYPPEWIMIRMYDFEKNGDLSKLFTNTKEKYLKDLISEKEKEAEKKKINNFYKHFKHRKMALSTAERGNFQKQLNEIKKMVNLLEEELNNGGEGGDITSNDITDATETGKSLLTASSPQSARESIGAGTGSSDLEIGSTATTAAAGNHTHDGYATTAQLSDLDARVTALENEG